MYLIIDIRNTIMIVFNGFTLILCSCCIFGMAFLNIYMFSIYLFGDMVLMLIFIVFVSISASK